MVEAIEEGRIVKVSEDYAHREGLVILKTFHDYSDSGTNEEDYRDLGVRESEAVISKNEKGFSIERLKRKAADSGVIKELVSNFHWKVSKARRYKGWSRKQFAKELEESEENIKMIENGLLPAGGGFVLVNKVEDKLGITIRKSAADFSQPARQAIVPRVPEKKVVEEKQGVDDSLFGDDIEIIE